MLRRLDITVPDDFEEPLLGLAIDLGVSSFSSPNIVDGPGGEEDFRYAGTTVVSLLYSTVEQDAAGIETRVKAWQQEEGITGTEPVTRDYEDSHDWMSAFRQYFQPIRVGGNIVVRPPWAEPLPEEQTGVSILIDPGMAFGTGTHETTRLCLQLLSGLDPHGTSFLDIGAGSGILAFYLMKRGAERGVALEIDGPAVENMRKNGRLNAIGAGLEMVCGDLATWQPPFPADILVANITSPVLLAHLPRLAGWLRPGGTGVFSGINSTNAPSLRRAFSDSPWSEMQEQSEGEWHAFRVTRTS